jgi:hypothetical protein
MIGGGLPVFPAAASSCVLTTSIVVASVSMYAVRRGAKKFVVVISGIVAGTSFFGAVGCSSEGLHLGLLLAKFLRCFFLFCL